MNYKIENLKYIYIMGKKSRKSQLSVIDNDTETIDPVANEQVDDAELDVVEKLASNDVNVDTELITNDSVVADNVEPVVADNVEPVVSDNVEPVADNVDPVADNVEPVADNVEQVVDNVEPVADNVEPVADNVEPVVVDNVEPVVDNVEPVTEPVVAADVSEELVAKVFFTKDNKIASHKTNIDYTNKILDKYNKKDKITLIKNNKKLTFNIVNKSYRNKDVTLQFGNFINNDDCKDWIILQ